MTQELALKGDRWPMTTMGFICHSRRHLQDPMAHAVLTARVRVTPSQPLVSIQALKLVGFPGVAMLLI